MQWTVIVPMSPLDRAKTRLADASSSPARHRALVRAMRRDTAQAVLRSHHVARLVVVTGTPHAALDDLSGVGTREMPADQQLRSPTGTSAVSGRSLRDALRADHGRIQVIADPAHGGLNPAVAHAAVEADQAWPDDAIAVIVADLPALTAAAVELVLAAGEAVDLGVVLDRQGVGTTMLTAAPGHHLHPRFGPGSARRHLELGAIRLPAPLPARTDVDVLDDLDAARRLGFGPAMDRLFRAGELPLLPGDRRD